jgi:hypothetical protein
VFVASVGIRTGGFRSFGFRTRGRGCCRKFVSDTPSSPVLVCSKPERNLWEIFKTFKIYGKPNEKVNGRVGLVGE